MCNIEICERYDKRTLRNNKNKLYIFGDNIISEGKGGQAIIRDEENAIGIPTKKFPTNKSNAFFKDGELKINIGYIDAAIIGIKNVMTRYEILVFPLDGLGTGRANLKKFAPKTYGYLVHKLKEEFGYENGRHSS